MNLYVLVKFDDAGEPYMDMGGDFSYNSRPRMFRNGKMALNYAAKHDAKVVELTVESPDGSVSAAWYP